MHVARGASVTTALHLLAFVGDPPSPASPPADLSHPAASLSYVQVPTAVAIAYWEA